MEELTLWVVNYQVMVPVLRKPGTNIMTNKYVPKWRRITRPNGTTAWIIRMRLTLRGFRDWFAHLYGTYAGTATRQSQRLVASECTARHHEDWILVTVDVEKASLQGLIYDELHEVTGEPRRAVYFVPLAGSAALLRKVPGFEHFNEYTMCLKWLVPGTGTGDAPRACN